MLLHAVEEGRFFPLGSDREVESQFQLLSGTNRDLHEAAAQGTFRDDLLARINLWTFRLPALRDRPEDMEPNLDYELVRWSETQGTRVTFSKEARKLFLDFATSPQAAWSANFRDFSAAVQRMATLAEGGRISVPHVRDEIERLELTWQRPASVKLTRNDEVLSRYLGTDALAQLDRFERVQLADVLTVCCTARSLSEAGRTLFAESRKRRSSQNDADRVRKYLARFGISWADLNG